MKKSAFFAVNRLWMMGALALVVLSGAILLSLPGLTRESLALTRSSSNLHSEVTISNIQVTPNPFNSSNNTSITLSFNAEHAQGKHFNVAVLDPYPEMIFARGGMDLKEGLNTFTWTPPEDLKSGTYTFDFNVKGETKGYTIQFQVERN